VTGIDRLVAWVVIGLIVLTIVFIIFAIWCMCAAASEADDITEEWNKNWTGQKFKK
jgi:uncharacterized membrane protein YukC